MKEDNIGQLGDYDGPFCEQQYTHGSCHISLFKFKSFDQLIPPNGLKFRHLLSCGTVGLFQALEVKGNQLLYYSVSPKEVVLYHIDKKDAICL